MVNTARPYVAFLSLQALYNVSSTSTRSSDEVLDELKRVLEDRDIMYKEKGYVSLHDIAFITGLWPCITWRDGHQIKGNMNKPREIVKEYFNKTTNTKEGTGWTKMEED